MILNHECLAKFEAYFCHLSLYIYYFSRASHYSADLPTLYTRIKNSIRSELSSELGSNNGSKVISSPCFLYHNNAMLHIFVHYFIFLTLFRFIHCFHSRDKLLNAFGSQAIISESQHATKFTHKAEISLLLPFVSKTSQMSPSPFLD